jgi:hypothetical protein
MELDDMKAAWGELSSQVEKQKKLTDKLIMEMTRQQYKSKLDKIRTSEGTASVFCLAGAFTILINFSKYDTPVLVFSAVATAALLVIPCILSLWSIRRMQRIDIAGNSYKEALGAYARARHVFLSLQKLNLALGLVMVVTGLPVAVRLVGGPAAHIKTEVWYWFLPIGIILFGLFAGWVYRYYNRLTIQAENLLKDLQE